MDITSLIEQYKSLRLDEVIDHERFNLIAIDHHSTRIEGSTLTEIETQVLINEGRTPNGKPLGESLMVTDHHDALLFTVQQARAGEFISINLIKKINALLVMRNTGIVYNTVFGSIDSSTGAFRKGNVIAGPAYFPDYTKVEPLIKELVKYLRDIIAKPLLSVEDQLNLSFDAHFQLVSIYPFYDGNGRTSRLLMNYLQAFYDLPLAIVHSDHKAAYIQALADTRKQEDIEIFREFMWNEYAVLIRTEIEKYQEMRRPSKGRGFSFLF